MRRGKSHYTEDDLQQITNDGIDYAANLQPIRKGYMDRYCKNSQN